MQCRGLVALAHKRWVSYRISPNLGYFWRSSLKIFDIRICSSHDQCAGLLTNRDCHDNQMNFHHNFPVKLKLQLLEWIIRNRSTLKIQKALTDLHFITGHFRHWLPVNVKSVNSWIVFLFVDISCQGPDQYVFFFRGGGGVAANDILTKFSFSWYCWLLLSWKKIIWLQVFPTLLSITYFIRISSQHINTFDFSSSLLAVYLIWIVTISLHDKCYYFYLSKIVCSFILIYSHWHYFTLLKCLLISFYFFCAFWFHILSWSICITCF